MLVPKRANIEMATPSWWVQRCPKGGTTLAFEALDSRVPKFPRSSRQSKRRAVFWLTMYNAPKNLDSCFPHKPITLKAAEVPMGSGKVMWIATPFW